MEVLTDFFNWNVILRIISAVVLGFAVGLEREMTNKYAGLRTNILVCLGACVFTLISIYGFPMVSVTGDEYGTRDTARVAAQVVTGIGFIGGGTVLRHGATVFGLTTAATLWMSASIGMACGCGFTSLAIVSTVLAVGTLVVIRIFEKQYIHKGSKNPRKFKVSFYAPLNIADSIYSKIIEKFNSIFEINKANSTSNEGMVKISFRLDVFDKSPVQALHKELNNIEGIESVAIQELFE